MTCASCQHWHKVGLAHSSTTNKQGMCWRYPPAVAIVETAPRGEQIRTIWPETQENEVCGEYKENAKPLLEPEAKAGLLQGMNAYRKLHGQPPIGDNKPVGKTLRAIIVGIGLGFALVSISLAMKGF